MLVCNAKPANFAKETLLLRFVEENGTSTAFALTDKAKEQFEPCELWRIYDIELPGACVKQSSGSSRFGIENTYDVVMKFPSKHMQLSTRAWPFTYPYKFRAWEELNQLAADSFLDLLGKVVEIPVFDANSSFPKTVVKIGNNNLFQSIELLGTHTGVQLKLHDVVAFAGLKVREWNNQRTLQTAFLTVVEVNPTPRQDLDFAVDIEDAGPKRKALRMTPMTQITVAQVKEESRKILEATKAGSSMSPLKFDLVGTLTPLTLTFFENDAPILQKGSQDIMCWKTILTDKTGEMDVKVWDKPCYDIFGVTVSKFRDFWEKGVETSAEQQAILDILNKNLKEQVTCQCQTDIWRYGNKPENVTVQVNINAIEIAATASGS